MSTWEERMAERARERKRAARVEPYGDVMAPWRHDDDPDGILPQILAARCLGIRYGDPGPQLPDEYCRLCWGDRYIWRGNCWGLRHAGGTMAGCPHGCHAGEVWLA